MPRRTFNRSTPAAGKLIDMKTGKPIGKPCIPIVCERIRFYRERAGLEQKALAAAVGISGNAVSNWESGRTRPDINLLPDICERLGITLYELYGLESPGIKYTPKEQLLIGNYRLLSDGHKHAVDVMAETLLLAQQSGQCRRIRQLTRFERSLAAGTPDPTEFETAGESIFLYGSRLIDRADYVFSVNGDSMEQTFHSGDMVLVERTRTGSDLEYGDIGAFIVGNETYIKVYREDGLYSLNPAYAPIRFNGDETVYLIGRVIGTVGKEDIATQDDVEKYEAIHPNERKH